MRVNGLSGDVVGTIDKQTLRNKKLVNPVIIVNGTTIDLTATASPSSGDSTVSVISDLSNGLRYKLVSINGIIGLEETTEAAGTITVTDLSNGHSYKVISNNGVIGLEEV